MEIYFLMLAIPSALAVAAGKKKNAMLLSLVFAVFVFLVGFRYNVGMDWNNYEAIHTYIGRESPMGILTGAEPLSTIIFWFSAYIGSGTLLSNVVAAGMLMFGVLAFARRTPNPWLAVVAATPFLIIAFGMSGVRQAMAAGLLLYLMSDWERGSTVRRSVIVLIASLFHTSAAMAILFVLWDMRLRPGLRILMTVLIAPVLFYAYQQIESYSENVQFYQETYLGGEATVRSPGAVFHLALVGVPALLYFAFRNRLQRFLFGDNLILMGSVAVLAVFLLFFVSSTGASRLSTYLYFVPMAVYSSLSLIFPRHDRPVIVVGVVAAHFLILAAWLLYANNSFAHLPYRNILFRNVAAVG